MLSLDLQQEFLNMKGFSRTNLFYMKKWYLFYADQIIPQVVGQNPNSHELKSSLPSIEEIEADKVLEQSELLANESSGE